jgi:hypothetical protein
MHGTTNIKFILMLSALRIFRLQGCRCVSIVYTFRLFFMQSVCPTHGNPDFSILTVCCDKRLGKFSMATCVRAGNPEFLGLRLRGDVFCRGQVVQTGI